MARDYLNSKKLGHPKTKDRAFAAFLDGYIQSFDLFPDCYVPKIQKPVDALWRDFVRISYDTRIAFDNARK